MNNQTRSGIQPVRGRGVEDRREPGGQEDDASGTPTQRQTTSPTPVDYQKTSSQEDIHRITAYLSEKGMPQEVEGAWQRLREDVQKSTGRVEEDHVMNAIMELKAGMQEKLTPLENKMTGLSLGSFQTTTGNRSYASVAASEPRKLGQIPLPPGVKPVPARLERELLVRTEDKEFNKTGAQVIQLVNDQMDTGKALACRRLQSGDYAITLDSKDTKEHWQVQKSWLSALGNKAKIVQREFAILAHGIVINQIQTQNQPVAIQKIYNQNPGLKDKVQIIRVA